MSACPDQPSALQYPPQNGGAGGLSNSLSHHGLGLAGVECRKDDQVLFKTIPVHDRSHGLPAANSGASWWSALLGRIVAEHVCVPPDDRMVPVPTDVGRAEPAAYCCPECEQYMMVPPPQRHV